MLPKLLELCDTRAAAQLLAEALHDDPAYAFVFPKLSRRRAQLEYFFRRHLANHVRQRCSWSQLDPTGALEATVTLRPPQHARLPASTLIYGLAAFTWTCGPPALRRLLRVASLYDELESAAASGKPHGHVHMMAVNTDKQGRGIGSALLDEVLRSRSAPSGPIVLTTHKPINVRFYERAGFRVVLERELRPDGMRAYPVWCMRRE